MTSILESFPMRVKAPSDLQRSAVAVAIADAVRPLEPRAWRRRALAHLAVRAVRREAVNAAVVAAAQAIAQQDGWDDWSAVSRDSQARYLDRAIAACGAYDRWLTEGCDVRDDELLQVRAQLLTPKRTLGDRLAAWRRAQQGGSR